MILAWILLRIDETTRIMPHKNRARDMTARIVPELLGEAKGWE
jgi:hypothetical protein